MSSAFLTARWLRLAFANYETDPAILKPLLPVGVELDPWQGRHLVSLVGFRFADTRLLGMAIPFHRHFPEVNLRFYVRYRHPAHGWVRGVVFVKEIVPKPAITFVANTLYHERYETRPMRWAWKDDAQFVRAAYEWKTRRWNNFAVTADPASRPVDLQGESGFITEHYWGFSAHGNRTMSYQVAHPSWNLFPVQESVIDLDFAENYGPDFGFLNKSNPLSVMLAEGSEVAIYQGERIR